MQGSCRLYNMNDDIAAGALRARAATGGSGGGGGGGEWRRRRETWISQ